MFGEEDSRRDIPLFVILVYLRVSHLGHHGASRAMVVSHYVSLIKLK